MSGINKTYSLLNFLGICIFASWGIYSIIVGDMKTARALLFMTLVGSLALFFRMRKAKG